MIYSALILGFAGSLHCFAMCGPLSLLLPADRDKRLRYIAGRLVYNLGRISTYALLGLLIGLAGEEVGFRVPQKVILLVLGSFLLIYIILPSRITRKAERFTFINKLMAFVKRQIAGLHKKHGLLAQYFFGLVNGLIPCGLVYAALSGAFLTSSLSGGIWFMVLFGLGTLPMMMSFGVIGSLMSGLIKIRPKLIYTVSYFLLAVFMLYKGINLPITHYANSHEITVCRTP